MNVTLGASSGTCSHDTRHSRTVTSEAFKPYRDLPPFMEHIILDDDDEKLAPAVVVATIALLGVFVVGFLVQIVGLLI